MILKNKYGKDSESIDKKIVSDKKNIIDFLIICKMYLKVLLVRLIIFRVNLYLL